MADSAFSLDYSGDSIDNSTVDVNPSIDQSVSGTDGGASDLSDLANTIGRWGVTIGSIVTNTPIAAAQTRTGAVVPIGAAGSSLAPVGGFGASIQAHLGLLLAVIVVAGAFFYFRKEA